DREVAFNHIITGSQDSGISATIEAEVLASRGNADNLKGRLDGFDSQLFENGKLMNKEISQNKVKRPLMTFIDDDGRNDSMFKWLPIINETGVKITIPLVTSLIGTNQNYLTWENVEYLKSKGVEFCSHTHTHARLSELTEEKIRDEFNISQNILKKYGLQSNVMVYPYGADNSLVRKLTREYFRVGVDVDEGINTPPLKTFALYRKTLAENGFNTLDYYKQQVDLCVANNGWLIWKSHCQYPEFDDIQIEYIKELITYARNQGVEIVNVNQGLDIYGNIIDIGDYPLGEYTIIDCDGVMHSKSNSIAYKQIYDRNIAGNKPITEFTKETLTSNVVISSWATNFPEGKSGILDTYRGITDDYAYQIYKVIGSNRVYKNYWDKDKNNWSPFEKIADDKNGIFISKVDAFNTTNIPNDFNDGVITYTRISSVNNDVSNFPEGKAGELKTCLICGVSYSYQEYEVYSSENKYKRKFINNVWGDWKKIQTSTEKVVLFDFGLIPSKSTKEVTVIASGVKNTNFIIASPVGVFMGGLTFSAYNNINDKITIRIHNGNSSDVTITQDFRIKILY
ncbi:MAG: polysaccharide deacetylase family protein, partial [Clostridium sp.]|uniref:polysaccharide deacetylase family protein n=1 Tax=Clostridium sp. TaxID=1506 RepID=UPI003F2D6168